MPDKKIVIVEDEDELRRYLAHVFEGRGYEVHSAGNGRAGIDKIVEVRPDVVMVDVMMPVVQGHEVCRFVRRHPELAGVKIVILSSLFPDRSEGESLSDAYLIKPARAEDILSAVENLLATA